MGSGEIYHAVANRSAVLSGSGPLWGYNKAFWSGLTSAEQHSVLMEASARSMARMIINYVKRADEALEEAKSKGNIVSEPADDLKASVESFREESLGNVYKTATDKFGLANGKEVIDAFRATVSKWEGLLSSVDVNDEDALTALAMKEIYGDLDPVSYGVK